MELPYFNNILFTNIGYFVSFPILMTVIPFSFYIMLARTSNIILKNS